MSDEEIKLLDEDKLIRLLDVGLSTHHFLKELLEDAEEKLAETNYDLIMKMRDLYAVWRRNMAKKGRKFAQGYGNLVSKSIVNLGIEKARQQICEQTPNKNWEERYKRMLKLEKKFYKMNATKISRINGKYLVKFLEERKKYVKEEEKYLFLFERIKKLYNEYKKKLKDMSHDSSGIFKNKDPENPSKYRASYEGELITDFIEKYIEEVEEDLKSDKTKPEVLIKKNELFQNEQIYKEINHIYQNSLPDILLPGTPPSFGSTSSSGPPSPISLDLERAARTMPPGAEEWISDDDNRPTTPDYDPDHPPWHEGGVKVGKSPRKKTAMEIHQEKFENPNFKKRLFATKDTKVQIFEKGARKKHGAIIKKLLEDFGKGYRSRFGEPNEVDDHIIRLIRKQQKDQSKITRGDLEDVKKYRAESAENRAKAHYVYTSHRNMVERNKKMRAELLRRREILRKQDEEDSDGSSDGEIAYLKKEADEDIRLMRLKDGSFMKLSPNYEGNLGKTSPIPEVDTGKSEVEMDEDKFIEYSLKRGGRRTRRRRRKLKKKTKKRKKRKTKRKRIRRKRTRKRVKAYI
jgi:hypothetical protein